MVRRVRKVLRLKAKCKSPLVNAAFFSGDRTVEKVPRVKLQSRFGREHAQNPAGSGLIDFGRLRYLAGALIQYKVVVVPSAQAQLNIVRINSLPDSVRLAKIERRAFYGLEVASRNKGRIHGRHAGS